MRRTHGRPTGTPKGSSLPKAPAPQSSAAPSRPPSRILPDDEVEIIDLGDDLIEEVPEAAAPPVMRRTRRHRRPTLRSTISAELAESMAPESLEPDEEEELDLSPEAEAAPRPAPEVVTSAAVVETTVPTALELSAPSEVDSSPYLSMDAAIPVAAIHDDVTVQVVNPAPAEGAARQEGSPQSAEASRVIARDQTTDVGGASAAKANRAVKATGGLRPTGAAAAARGVRDDEITAPGADDQIGRSVTDDLTDDLTDPGDLGHSDVTAVGPRP